MDPDLWLRLAKIAEASVHRYGPRCPAWLELEDLKADIVARIPWMMTKKPPAFHSTSKRMTDDEYYVYCRSSFEARRILCRQPKFTGELIDMGEDHEDFGRIDAIDQLNDLLIGISPTTRRVLLLHYSGRRNDQIARYLGYPLAHVQRILSQAKYDLGITPEPAEPNETPRRLAA